ncbi:hypothetical protein E2C01_055329 [Portunus trituberculatus]|uniref:Uncharacterized protein n=1 Tax=Portunus trituberculatus TaxID=210409 RepID=A0A5B7GMF6_PORTR|nr:hypothetical protein [Portunus trituberculatus]
MAKILAESHWTSLDSHPTYHITRRHFLPSPKETHPLRNSFTSTQRTKYRKKSTVWTCEMKNWLCCKKKHNNEQFLPKRLRVNVVVVMAGKKQQDEGRWATVGIVLREGSG